MGIRISVKLLSGNSMVFKLYQSINSIGDTVVYSYSLFVLKRY